MSNATVDQLFDAIIQHISGKVNLENTFVGDFEADESQLKNANILLTIDMANGRFSNKNELRAEIIFSAFCFSSAEQRTQLDAFNLAVRVAFWLKHSKRFGFDNVLKLDESTIDIQPAVFERSKVYNGAVVTWYQSIDLNDTRFIAPANDFEGADGKHYHFTNEEENVNNLQTQIDIPE